MEEKINELIDLIDDRDLDVVCVTETKRKGNDTSTGQPVNTRQSTRDFFGFSLSWG